MSAAPLRVARTGAAFRLRWRAQSRRRAIQEVADGELHRTPRPAGGACAVLGREWLARPRAPECRPQSGAAPPQLQEPGAGACPISVASAFSRATRSSVDGWLEKRLE